MSSSYNLLLVNIWCMLCLGLHHYKLKPPIIAGAILPYFINSGCLLWAIECPTQPITIWVKACKRIPTNAYWVVQAIIKVAKSVTVNATSHDHNGSNRGYTFLNIFSYYWDYFEGLFVETIGKDFKIFSAC